MKSALAGRGLVVRLASSVPIEELPLDDLPGIEVYAFDPRDESTVRAPLAAVVLDCDEATDEELLRACESPRLRQVPKLVVARGERSHSVARLLNAEGAVVAPVASLDRRDLSRRLRTLCDLGTTRLLNALLQQAFEDGVTGFSIADAGGDQQLRAVSRAFERLTGYTQDEILGRNCRFLRNDDGDDEQRARFRQDLARDHRAKMLVRNYRKDGTPFWNDLTVFAFRAQGVELPLLGGVLHDVTELVEARSAIEQLTKSLLEQQAFDRAVLDSVDLGILTTNAQGNVTYCNRAAREFLAVDADALDEFDVRAALSLERPFSRLAGIGCTRELRSRDGVERQVDVVISRGDPAFDALSLLFVLRDVTRENKLQTEMHRVEHLAAMGTMVAGFAHEVRNPVASLRSMAESLDEDLVEAGVRLPHAKRMLQVLARIERLVSTSLQFGRPASPRFARHRPWSILSAALSTISGRTRECGEDIRIEVEPELPDILVDEGQLVQVLVILMSNALDAALSPRRVLVRVVGTSDREPRSQPKSQPPALTVRFEVHDEGPGVPPEVVTRMFDPFFTTKATGTGLGLSIAQQIVRENGARLELSSAKGPTVFVVECPIAST